jgi:adenylate cyclase 10
VFLLVAARERVEPDLALFQQICERPAGHQSEAYNLFLEILELKQFDPLANFPPTKAEVQDKDRRKIFVKQVKQIVIEFLGYYFEEVPKKYKDKNPRLSRIIESVNEENVSRHSLKGRALSNVGNIIAPILFCFDDMQNFDELSFIMIRLIIKSFERVLMIGLLRDQFLDMSALRYKSQEDIYISNIQMIESVVEPRQFHSFVLRGMHRLDKEDEFLKLLRINFNISTFAVATKGQTPDSKVVNRSSLDVQQQDMKKQVLNNHYLFFENKAQLMEKDMPLLLLHFIYLKSQGNPHLGINLVQNLITQKLLTIENGRAIL